VNTNHKDQLKQNRANLKKAKSPVSLPLEILWALIGLLLTIVSTFFPVSIINWSDHGVVPHSLGVTLQIGAVLLTGCLGGKNAGALAQVAYLILGLTQLPVFAHGGDWQYWHEPTFGYILGFIPGAWVCGWLAFRRRPKLENLAFSAVCGLLVIHLCGLLYIVGLSLFNPLASKIPLNILPTTIFNYSLMPLPSQLVIICAVTIIAYLFRLILFY
jgi:biotin transport system substrate-specific component